MPSDNKSFYFYFEENMEALGLPCPESLFGSASAAVGAICTVAASIKELGAHATMGQVAALIEATEAASPVAAIIYKAGEVFLGCLASFYLGACIGSLAVAEAKSGGTCLTLPIRAYIKLQIEALRPYRHAAKILSNISISDIFECAKRHGIPIPSWLQKTLIAYPEICNADLRRSARIAVHKAQWSKMAVA